MKENSDSSPALPNPALPARLPASSSIARKFIVVAICIALSAFALPAEAQTPPPAPVLIQPAAGAALVQPITLAWSAVVDPGGPIGSYVAESQAALLDLFQSQAVDLLYVCGRAEQGAIRLGEDRLSAEALEKVPPGGTGAPDVPLSVDASKER